MKELKALDYKAANVVLLKIYSKFYETHKHLKRN